MYMTFRSRSIGYPLCVARRPDRACRRHDKAAYAPQQADDASLSLNAAAAAGRRSPRGGRAWATLWRPPTPTKAAQSIKPQRNRRLVRPRRRPSETGSESIVGKDRLPRDNETADRSSSQRAVSIQFDPTRWDRLTPASLSGRFARGNLDSRCGSGGSDA